MAYTVERGIAILLERQQMTDDDKTSLQQAFADNHVNDEALGQFFNTPERQKALQQAMSEAIQMTVDAAREEGSQAQAQT